MVKVQDIWEKIGKTGKRWGLLVSLLASFGVLSPIITKTSQAIVNHIHFIRNGSKELHTLIKEVAILKTELNNAPQRIDSLELLVKNLRRFQTEAAGVFMSNTKRFDASDLSKVLSGSNKIFNELNWDYRVKMNGEYVPAALGVTERGDIIVHVVDNMVNLYQANYSHSMRRFTYNTFEEDGYMIIEIKD